MAHRGVGLRNEGRALDNSELLPPYSDSSNGGLLHMAENQAL
jgi:hypothetical protein